MFKATGTRLGQRSRNWFDNGTVCPCQASINQFWRVESCSIISIPTGPSKVLYRAESAAEARRPFGLHG